MSTFYEVTDELGPRGSIFYGSKREAMRVARLVCEREGSSSVAKVDIPQSFTRDTILGCLNRRHFEASREHVAEYAWSDEDDRVYEVPVATGDRSLSEEVKCDTK